MGPAAGFANRRRSPRGPIILPASVVTMSAYQYLELVDLSATGAKLRGSSLPAVGKTALLRLDRYHTLCRIVWAEHGLCGVHFDMPVPPGVLADFRKPAETKVEIAISNE